MEFLRWVVVFFLSFDSLSLVRGQCRDQPYFHYKCSQLEKYCSYPQAHRLRNSCPVTCRSCRETFIESKQLASLPNFPPGIESFLPPTRVQLPSSPLNSPVFDGEEPAVQTKQLQPVYEEPPPSSIEVPATVNAELPTSVLPRQVLPDVVKTFKHDHTSHKNWTAFLQPVIPIPAQLPIDPSWVKIRHDTPRSTKGALERPAVTERQQLAQQHIKSCCRKLSVSRACFSMCSYQLTKKDILLKAAAGFCTLEDAGKWAQCAAGGQKNAACCAARGATGCEDLCDGRLPENFNKLLQCITQYLPLVLDCHQQNLQLSPR